MSLFLDSTKAFLHFDVNTKNFTAHVLSQSESSFCRLQINNSQKPTVLVKRIENTKIFVKFQQSNNKVVRFCRLNHIKPKINI